ncbi:hypothetical protein KKH38_00340 [Patescibacteria group bacterium]|nr:hypothetical protein [Patescibacteria group bacterium]MBU4601274.1 hypothetical protein [Patescibacteria group bacterium]MCG2698084.1 hypothetical protein [Candidatus Parcubacteria bacterium]
MPKINLQNQDQENDDIRIKEESEPSLAEFIKRPVPSEEELEDFENMVGEEHGFSSGGLTEAKEDEIEESLSEIYRDENGGSVNVRKLDIKKKHSFFFFAFSFLITAAILAGAAFGIYSYYARSGSGSRSVEFFIESKKEVIAGEEFFYVVNYKNLERVDIKNVEIKLIYPQNFIFLDSEPAAGGKKDTWRFDSISANREGIVKIKGKLIAATGQSSIILADITWTPANFSSEFKKSSSFETVIKNSGIEFSFVNQNSALVGDENEIIVKHKAKEENYINNFRLIIDPADNIDFSPSDAVYKENKSEWIEYSGGGAWQISEVAEKEKEIKIKFKFTDKKSDNQDIVLKFEHLIIEEAKDGVNALKKYYLFQEEAIAYEVIKSDLNLSLIINGNQSDQGIDFGQTLNYSIVYANKGQSIMKDIVIMAVLESEFLDWPSLSDKNSGKISDNAIIWSKKEIPSLESLDMNDEGIIDFSIQASPFSEIDLSKKYQVKSYAQYSIGAASGSGEAASGEATGADKDDKRSNTIINKINSDLSLDEQVRYFNDDNIAVGSGPLPPKAGETTSYKVYWALTNNLHELSGLQVIANLPNYVKWDNKNRASAGNIQYDSETGNVVWQIGRLPNTVYRADAEFNISITPAADDINKIMVLLPGTIAQAVDYETKDSINKTGSAKTTKLEDDDIVESDGRVVE